MNSFLKLGTALATAFVLVSTPALSLTITNSDDEEYTVVVGSGDKKAEHKLAAGKSIEDDCVGAEGCEISLEGKDAKFMAKKDNKLVIKGGEISVE